jgi:uncharacterized protein YbjT (DUF2867 family)
MFTILGITGNVGGATAQALLAAGKKVRAGAEEGQSLRPRLQPRINPADRRKGRR